MTLYPECAATFGTLFIGSINGDLEGIAKIRADRGKTVSDECSALSMNKQALSRAPWSFVVLRVAALLAGHV